MVKYIIINGHARAGKSTFANEVVEILEQKKIPAIQISSVDLVKQLAKEAGWNGEKTPQARKFLSDMKMLLSNSPWGNLTMRDVVMRGRALEMASDNKTVYVLVMVREPEEIQQYVEKMGAMAVMVRNNRVDSLPASNLSDAEVENFSYHYYVNNSGTLDDLYQSAEDFTDYLLAHFK